MLPFQLHMKADVHERVVYESAEQVRRVIVERGLDRLLKDEVVVPLKRKKTWDWLTDDFFTRFSERAALLSDRYTEFDDCVWHGSY